MQYHLWAILNIDGRLIIAIYYFFFVQKYEQYNTLGVKILKVCTQVLVLSGDYCAYQRYSYGYSKFRKR